MAKMKYRRENMTKEEEDEEIRIWHEEVEEMKTFFGVRGLEEVAECLGQSRHTSGGWRKNRRLSDQALRRYQQLKEERKKQRELEEFFKVQFYNESFYMPLSTLLLREYDPLHLRVLRILNDSMSPFVKKGDYICIHTKTITGDGVFAVLLNNEVYIKRVQNLGNGRVKLKSDNPQYEELILNLEDLHCLGLVVLRVCL